MKKTNKLVIKSKLNCFCGGGGGGGGGGCSSGRAGFWGHIKFFTSKVRRAGIFFVFERTFKGVFCCCCFFGVFVVFRGCVFLCFLVSFPFCFSRVSANFILVFFPALA